VKARLLRHELLELPEGGLGVDVDLVGDAGELDLDADGGDGGAAGRRVGVRGALLDEHPLEDVISIKSQYQIKEYLYVFLLETGRILVIIDFCIYLYLL
jgi:hypothetical protein